MVREKPKKKSSISAEPELVSARRLCAAHIGQEVAVVGRRAGILGELSPLVDRYTGILESIHANGQRVRVVLSQLATGRLVPSAIIQVDE